MVGEVLPRRLRAGMLAAGVLLCVFGNAASAVGTVLQKEAIGAAGEEDGWYRRPLWWCGLGLVVLGAGLDLAALGLAPVSVVGALAVLVMVFTPPAACVVSGARPSRREWAGTGVCVAGAALAAAAAVLGGAGRADGLRAAGALASGRVLGVLVGYAGGATALVCASPRFPQLLPVGAALIGGGGAVVAKLALRVLAGEAGGGWVGWVLLGGVLLAVAAETHVIAHGLQVNGIVYAVCAFQSTFILATIAAGGVAGREFDGFGAMHAVGLAYGVALTLAGVRLLATEGDGLAAEAEEARV